MKNILYILVIIAIAGCKLSEDKVQAQEKNSQKKSEKKAIDESLYCKELTEMKGLQDSTGYARTNILNYTKKQNCLCVKYEYSGCGDGNSMLIWNGEFNESNRPEVNMELRVQNAGKCEQLLTDSACFSLKKMQLVGNEVLLKLNKTEQNLLYKAPASTD